MSLANKIILTQESGCEESLAPVHGNSVEDILDEMESRVAFGFILARFVESEGEDGEEFVQSMTGLMEAAITSLIERRRADRG